MCRISWNSVAGAALLTLLLCGGAGADRVPPDSAELRATDVLMGQPGQGQWAWRLSAREMAIARRPQLKIFGVKGVYRYHLTDVELNSWHSRLFEPLLGGLEANLPVFLERLTLHSHLPDRAPCGLTAREVEMGRDGHARLFDVRLQREPLHLESPLVLWNPNERKFVIPRDYAVKNEKGTAKGWGLKFDTDLNFEPL